MPGNGAKVKSGINSNAFANEPGIKNSNTKIIKYKMITDTYGDWVLIKL